MAEENRTQNNDTEDSGFFSRWSRLKNQHREEEEEEEENQAIAVTNQTQQTESITEQTEQLEQELETPETPVLTDADMPDIETLNEDSDYSGFLSPGVSEELRRLALRKLFKFDFFHIRDGLDDYDDDFTQFEKLGDIVTADMRFQMEQQAKAKLQQELQAKDNNQPAELSEIDTEID
ncbi:MAG: DUF3306 domain-containing protein, partial [Pseudomonadota bacterium]